MNFIFRACRWAQNYGNLEQGFSCFLILCWLRKSSSLTSFQKTDGLIWIFFSPVLFTLGVEDRMWSLLLHVSNLVSIVKTRLKLPWRISWEQRFGVGMGGWGCWFLEVHRVMAIACGFWQGTSQHTAMVSVLHDSAFYNCRLPVSWDRGRWMKLRTLHTVLKPGQVWIC